ncbi:hypothetical protein APASM_2929 [Actinosynnema pretiosum subsp. pretiosum]|nr:hypothetical protein APASM_2929 [Actinosynnema pretiosum subsp. pretiosum]
MLRDVYRGSVRWDLLADFPEQDPVDRATGDEVVARAEELLRALVAPTRSTPRARCGTGSWKSCAATGCSG